MKRKIKNAGIMVLILGFIHISATPFILPMMKVLGKQGLLTCAYMFICTGISLCFIGWLQYFLSNQAETDDRARKVLRNSVYLMMLLGIGAIAAMWNNPFAYVFFFIALYELYLIRTAYYLKKNHEIVS